VEILAGDFAAAEAQLRRDYLRLEAVGERYFRSSIAAFLAQALWAQAKFEDAETFTDIAEELTDADDVWSQVAWQTVRAKLLARAGRADEAIARAETAVDLASKTSNIEQHADALVDVTRCSVWLAGLPSRDRPSGKRSLSTNARETRSSPVE
jgi:ATP/maltotriose-dependent transcriptional regulator MalT